MARLTKRERRVVRAVAHRTAERFRGSGLYDHALEVARVGAEHAAWQARLEHGEWAAALECERCEDAFAALAEADGLTHPEAIEVMQRNLRRPRLALQYRLTHG